MLGRLLLLAALSFLFLPRAAWEQSLKTSVWGPVVPTSPCPRYFRYIGGGEAAPLAVASIPVHVRQLPVTLRVRLALPVALKTKYVGMVVLADHPTLVLGNLLAGKAHLVNYTIRFPLPQPIPTLTELSINNVTICTGSSLHINTIYGGVVTNILLEHTFPAQPFLIRNKIGIGHDSFTVFGDANKSRDPKCGQPKHLYFDEVDVALSREKWPWLTAIFQSSYNGLKFQCAGSLISKRHVVTAAHCFRNQMSKEWVISDFVVYLGLHNLDQYEEPNTQVKKVTKIEIHPEYNPMNYMADIAILVIEEAELNEKVSPVCLWNGGVSLKPLTGHLGTVVGWGINRVTKRIQSEPEVFQLPIVDQAECLRSRKEFLYITSERTLCAGLRNGTGPCNGDSGSGLLILSYNSENSLAWHLRGLISLSLLDRKMETCDLNEYIVFTDVARFNNWIANITSLS